MAPRESLDIDRYLPLKPVAFQVLLSLSES